MKEIPFITLFEFEDGLFELWEAHLITKARIVIRCEELQSPLCKLRELEKQRIREIEENGSSSITPLVHVPPDRFVPIACHGKHESLELGRKFLEACLRSGAKFKYLGFLWFTNEEGTRTKKMWPEEQNLELFA